MRRTPGSVLIVGAGLAGARCAETLRVEGYEGRVALVGAEAEPPYERPALSKEVLAGSRPHEDLALRTPDWWAEREIELVTGTRIGAIDPQRRVAMTTSGCEFAWDALVLATGARARAFPGHMPRGVHTLRSLADALALQAELQPGLRLVIVGAGFVGTEVASTALELGVEVILLEGGQGPLERVLGPEASALLARRYRARGVDLRLEAMLGGFSADPQGRLGAAVLRDGTTIPCDVAVVALGATPECPPIQGLADDVGISTDACGRTSLPGVYACGDVANAWRPAIGRRLRIEHWTNAAGQGACVARTIVGRAAPYDELPYFWSDQFGLRLQYVGHADEWAAVDIEGDEDSFSAIYRRPDGRPLGALLANRAHEIGAVRRELAAVQVAA
jgi:3-phenylpropionate/trans-cinnamate dioxygenase ferredoxin reductase component